VSDESLDEVEARLFASARGERASSAVREQTLARMLAKRKKSRAGGRVVVLAALAAALGGALVVLSFARSPVPSIGAERFPPGSARPTREAAEDKPVAPLVPPPDIPKLPESNRGDAVGRDKAPASKPSASPPAPLTLEEETSALQAVQAELRSGKPSAALALLDGYVRAARHRHLAAEAELLRIQALAASGRGADASALAKRFVEAYPTSPLVDRARQYSSASAVDAESNEGSGR
jgi:hypothetical protein